MSPFEVKPGEGPAEGGKVPPEKTPRELMLRIRQALDSKEGSESLSKIGDLLYETYKGEEYSPAIVLSSIREIYDDNKGKFNPKLTFNKFIQSFGPGMVMLCQQKLIAVGEYDLGKFGKNKDGVDGKLGKMTGKALQRYFKKPGKLTEKEEKAPRVSSRVRRRRSPRQAPRIQPPAPPQLPVAPPAVETVVPPQIPQATDPDVTLGPPRLPQPPVAPPPVQLPGEQENPIPVSAIVEPAAYTPTNTPADVQPEPTAYVPAVYNPTETTVSATPYVPPEASGDAEIVPYAPGTESGTITPNKYLNPQLDAIYAQNKTTLNHRNLPELYGRSEAEVRRFIVYNDPITGGTISFLGRTIDHKGRSGAGINMLAIPFLKIAEEEIRKRNINYQPRNKIGGFAYRNMRLNGKMSNVKSHHAYGLAIDMDSDTNDSKDGRGDIPDEVVMALVNAGFAWGGTRNEAFSYLGRDAMHFQLRFDARDPEAQRILHSSPIGMKYWNAILPLLPDDYKRGLDQESLPMA